MSRSENKLHPVLWSENIFLVGLTNLMKEDEIQTINPTSSLNAKFNVKFTDVFALSFTGNRSDALHNVLNLFITNQSLAKRILSETLDFGAIIADQVSDSTSERVLLYLVIR